MDTSHGKQAEGPEKGWSYGKPGKVPRHAYAPRVLVIRFVVNANTKCEALIVCASLSQAIQTKSSTNIT